MREAFRTQLADVKRQVLQMGLRVDEALDRALAALLARDDDLAAQVVEGDDAVDELAMAVEQECLALMVLQQPMAGNLRFLGCSLKIATDLERMADHAVDIARSVIRHARLAPVKPLEDLHRMAAMTREMLRGVLDAYARGDQALARQIALRDHEVDLAYRQLFMDLIQLMVAKPEMIPGAVHLLMAGQHLERAADHATNVSEWVIYMVTGQRPELND